jgi:hypothetical protein
LNALHTFIVKLRGSAPIWVELGAILNLAIDVRWTSKFNSVNCFMESREKIEMALRKFEPAWMPGYQKLMLDYGSLLEAYCQIIGPMAKSIKLLEVS